MKKAKSLSTKTQAPADAGAELIVMPNSDSEATSSNDNSEEITVKLSAQVILENFLNKHSKKRNLIGYLS